MVSWRGQPFWSFRGESDSLRFNRGFFGIIVPWSSPNINSQELSQNIGLDNLWAKLYLSDFCYSFVVEFLYRGLYAHHLLGFACLRCLKKSRTYSPKWWFKGVLPWYKVKKTHGQVPLSRYLTLPWSWLSSCLKKTPRTKSKPSGIHQKTGKLSIIAQWLYEAKMSLGGNHQRHLMLAKKVGARADGYK